MSEKRTTGFLTLFTTLSDISTDTFQPNLSQDRRKSIWHSVNRRDNYCYLDVENRTIRKRSVGYIIYIILYNIILLSTVNSVVFCSVEKPTTLVTLATTLLTVA